MRYYFGHTLVTGASGAIGGAIVEAIHKADGEAVFSCLDIDPDGARERLKSAGANGKAYKADISAIESLEALVDQAVEDHGPVDTLINCAGIMDIVSLTGTSWERGMQQLAVDFVAPMRLMHLVAGDMEKRGRGAIVNVASMAGRVPLRGCTFYGGAKAGIGMASEIARLELAPAGVRVVTVYPGPVRSHLETRARGHVPESLISKALPMGEPAPLARLIVKAVARNRARVVYPTFFKVANGFAGIASAVTARFSPKPLK